MNSPQFAINSSPTEPLPWVATQLEYDDIVLESWATDISGPERFPISTVTNVSFALDDSLPRERNYAQSVQIPDWHVPLDDEDRSLVVGEILEFPKLPLGWDGSPEDVPPSSGAADQAATFVELLPAFVPVPEPSAASDGEIILFWKDSRKYVEVGFRGGEFFSYFAETETEKIKGSVRVEAMFSSNDELATFLIEAFADGALHL